MFINKNPLSEIQATDELLKAGLELVLVTDREYQWHQVDIARKDYDITSDCFVPTRELIIEILNVIDMEGLYNITTKYQKDKALRIMIAKGDDYPSSKWCYGIEPNDPRKNVWFTRTDNGNDKALIAFWRYTEEEKQRRRNEIVERMSYLQSMLNADALTS